MDFDTNSAIEKIEEPIVEYCTLKFLEDFVKNTLPSLRFEAIMASDAKICNPYSNSGNLLYEKVFDLLIYRN